MTGLEQALAAWPGLGLLLGALAGLMVGSFLNVVIGRLPAIALEEDREDEWPMALVRPGSHCPDCGSAVRTRHNIPLLGWLMLRGRCRDCGSGIPVRYPAVELLGGVTGLACVLAFGPTGQAVAVGLFLMALIALAAIDFEHQILPDQITLPMVWAGLLVNAFGTVTTLQGALFGAVTGYAVLHLIRLTWLHLRGVEGMGRGDPKLAAMIGAWLGVQAIMTTMLIAFVGGTLIAVAGMLLSRMSAADRVPFGPALAFGAAAAAFGVSFY